MIENKVLYASFVGQRLNIKADDLLEGDPYEVFTANAEFTKFYPAGKGPLQLYDGEWVVRFDGLPMKLLYYNPREHKQQWIYVHFLPPHNHRTQN